MEVIGMAARKYKTLCQKLDEVVPTYVSRFIIWYFSDKETRLPFEQFKTCEVNIKDYDSCCEWLTREDAQKAIQIYMKHMKTYNLMQVYYKMLDKALNGDVNAAKWIESFSNSDFFDESQDEMDSFLNNVNIPALKKGGGKNGA
jgi:hypothetical protein